MLKAILLIRGVLVVQGPDLLELLLLLVLSFLCILDYTLDSFLSSLNFYWVCDIRLHLFIHADISGSLEGIKLPITLLNFVLTSLWGSRIATKSNTLTWIVWIFERWTEWATQAKIMTGQQFVCRYDIRFNVSVLLIDTSLFPFAHLVPFIVSELLTVPIFEDDPESSEVTVTLNQISLLLR